MKTIALSIEQMKILQSLGVNMDNASMVYCTYKDITGKWIERDNYTKSHFEIDEKSKPITTLGLRNGEKYLYHDMNDCSNYSCCEIISAFTLQDIIELLPKELKSHDLVLFMDNHIQYEKWDGVNQAKILVQFDGKTLLDTAYKMLCWCAKNGYLKGEKVIRKMHEIAKDYAL